MTGRVPRFAVIALLLALASASAGASASRPPVLLTASPAHVELSGAGRATVRVTNSGVDRVVLDVSRAGFSLDLRGRPKIVAAGDARRSAVGWLGVSPRSLALGPGVSRAVTVAAKPPSRAEPGDHDALVLLTTRRRMRGRVAVRMRMGVVVVVRVPGVVVHRLELRGARLRKSGRVHTLELLVANLGNVTESFTRRHAVASFQRAGRQIARAMAEPRALRPRTRGVLEFRCRGRVSGPVIARVDVVSESGRVLRRAFRLRF